LEHGTDYSLVKLQLREAHFVIISYHTNIKHQTPWDTQNTQRTHEEVSSFSHVYYIKNRFSVDKLPKIYESWNFNSVNYLFTTDTK